MKKGTKVIIVEAGDDWETENQYIRKNKILGKKGKIVEWRTDMCDEVTVNVNGKEYFVSEKH